MSWDETLATQHVCCDCGRVQQGRDMRYRRRGGLRACDECWPKPQARDFAGALRDPRLPAPPHANHV